jgi:hypothetical protein
MGRAKGKISTDPFVSVFGKRGDDKAVNFNLPTPNKESEEKAQQLLASLEQPPDPLPNAPYTEHQTVFRNLPSVLSQLGAQAPLFKDAPLVDQILHNIAALLAEGFVPAWSNTANQTADAFGIRDSFDSLTIVVHNDQAHIWPEGTSSLATIDHPAESETLCGIRFTLYTDDWERAPRHSFFIEEDEPSYCTSCHDTAEQTPENYSEIFDDDDSFFLHQTEKDNFEKQTIEHLKTELLRLINDNEEEQDKDLSKDMSYCVRKSYLQTLVQAAIAKSSDILYHSVTCYEAAGDGKPIEGVSGNDIESIQNLASLSRASPFTL